MRSGRGTNSEGKHNKTKSKAVQSKKEKRGKDQLIFLLSYGDRLMIGMLCFFSLGLSFCSLLSVGVRGVIKSFCL
jgi:hypothetical protein